MTVTVDIKQEIETPETSTDEETSSVGGTQGIDTTETSALDETENKIEPNNKGDIIGANSSSTPVQKHAAFEGKNIIYII